MKIVAKIKSGSKLYGTSTLESDTDYKVIFVPTGKDILIGETLHKVSSTPVKNSSSDIDIEYIPLKVFIYGLKKGWFNYLELLHAPKDLVETDLPEVWDYLVSYRSEFYTSELNRHITSAIKLASSTRENELLEPLFNFLLKIEDKNHKYIKDIKDSLPDFPGMFKSNQTYIVLDRSYDMSTTSVVNLLCSIKAKIFKASMLNGAFDFTSAAHIYRFLRQVETIIFDQNIVYPIPYADKVVEIKTLKHSRLEVSEMILEVIDRLNGRVIEKQFDFNQVDDLVERVYLDSVIHYYGVKK